MVEWSDTIRVFIACIGFGGGSVAISSYRSFKHRRADMPPATRNAGFWTDSRLYHAEALFAALAMAIPFSAITMMIATKNDITWSYGALILYAVAIYVLIGSLNLRPPNK